MTISSDDLVRRNAAFAATGAFAGLPFPTSDTLQVLGCVDSRVDPSDVLGLELGEGVVMRNIGGRITPATLRSWALLGRLGQGQPPRSGHLVILHHTDCGIIRLADYPEQLAAYFEIPADCCPALKMPTAASLTAPMWWCGNAPPPGRAAGLWWAGCRWRWAWRRLVVGDFGDGGAGGFFVNEGLAGCVGGDEGGDGEVVDGAGVAA
jgi:carbonic anhydrase